MEESFKWITKAISTSTSQFHLDCCEVLVELFGKKYGIDGEDEYNELLSSLLSKRKQYHFQS